MINTVLEKILFLDIETASNYSDLEALSKGNKHLSDVFENKSDYFDRRFSSEVNEETTLEEKYLKFSPLTPEFGRVICVTFGVFKDGEKKITSYTNQNELELLITIAKILNNKKMANMVICAHNANNFDIPFLAKRFILNGLLPPVVLPKHDSKPWERNVIDTKDIWSYGVYNTLSSLDLVCAAMGITSPKNNLSGDKVNETYWNGGIEEIKNYCEEDVLALMSVVEKLKNLV